MCRFERFPKQSTGPDQRVVHLGLLEHLDLLLDNARRVVVITGRPELERLFSEKLKNRLAAFLPVPVQASDQSSAERPCHYPTRYKEIIEMNSSGHEEAVFVAPNLDALNKLQPIVDPVDRILCLAIAAAAGAPGNPEPRLEIDNEGVKYKIPVKIA
jgi:hypothetical protein